MSKIKNEECELWKSKAESHIKLAEYWQKEAIEEEEKGDNLSAHNSYGNVYVHYANAIQFLDDAKERITKDLKNKLKKAQKECARTQRKCNAYREMIKQQEVNERNRLAKIIDNIPAQITKEVCNYFKKYESGKLSRNLLLNKISTVICTQVEITCNTIDAIKKKYGI